MAIDLSRIISVNGSVIGSPINQAQLINNALTENILIPADDTQRTMQFNSVSAVGAYFGVTSDEYLYATKYFNGYDGALFRPKSIIFSRYVQSATPAYIFSKSLIPATTIAAVIADAAPTFSININGTAYAPVLAQSDFAAVLSLADIANVLQTKLDAVLASITCTIIGNNQFCLTAPSGSNLITYAIGSLADNIGLSQTTAPTLSQGSTGGNAAYNMELIINSNPNFASLSYVTRLTNDTLLSGYPVTVDLTSWIATIQNNYVGLWWEGGTEAENITSTTNMRAILVAAGYGSTVANKTKYNTGIFVSYNGLTNTNPVTTNEIGVYSAFNAGMAASINYNRQNAKINFANQAQSGLPVCVTNTTDYDNLIAQSYNVYGQFAGRSNSYNLTQNGALGGVYLWIDNIFDAIWFNDLIQNKLAVLISRVRLAYNEIGKTYVRATITNAVQQALNAGVIETGNPFTAEQATEITALVGIDVTDILTNNGYYIYFPAVTPQQRINREPLNVYLLYTNGGCVNAINVGNIFVQ